MKRGRELSVGRGRLGVGKRKWGTFVRKVSSILEEMEIERPEPKQLRFADLHVHTRISDGRIPPEEAVEEASRAGLAAIAIADHDSISGIQAAIWAGDKYGIEVIPAVELSSGIDNYELHILGYYIDWRDKWFADKLSLLQEARRERARRIIDRLRGFGIDIDYNLVIALDGGVVGRPHIAQMMVDRGYVKTTYEAFDKYLAVGKPAYVSKYLLSPTEAIKMIKRVGGISVLAHPLFARADHLLPKLVEEGLRGIEVYHSKHDAATTEHYEQLAHKYGLLRTGVPVPMASRYPSDMCGCRTPSLRG